MKVKYLPEHCIL